MAYISRSSSAPSVGVIAQDIDVSPWTYNSLEFGKIKLPNSFSFTGIWDEFLTDEPKSAVLYPDAWDFFEPVPVLLFVTGRDLEKRKVSVTAYPSYSVSEKLSVKLRKAIPTAWFDDNYRFSGSTGGWTTFTDADAKDDKGNAIKVPAYQLFGYYVVANSYDVRYISPSGASLKITDSSQIWEINATQSLPDKTMAEILYVACYMGGFMAIPRMNGRRSLFSARWQCLNLVKTPFATTSPALNSHNTFVDYPFVDLIYNLNGAAIAEMGRRGLWLWAQWDSTVGTITDQAGGQNGISVGACGNNKWGWFMGPREASDGSITFADSFGGVSRLWNYQISDGLWRNVCMLKITSNCSFWTPEIFGTPSLKIYFNTSGVTTAPTVTNVMCNIGPEPMPLTERLFSPKEWSYEDPFGCDYVSVWDTAAELPDVDDVEIGDEVHQASAGYVRYSEGWTSPLLGYSKVGRGETEDLLSLPVNGKATSTHLIEDGKLLSGLILLSRPEPQASLQMVRRVALQKCARKVSFTSRDKLDLLKLQRFMTGYCSITSAKRSDALMYKYEGIYYPTPTPQLLTTSTLSFPPTGGTKMVAGIGRLPASCGSLSSWPVSVRYEQFGAAVSATVTVTAPLIIRDFGAYIKAYDVSQTSTFSVSGGVPSVNGAAAVVTEGATASVNLNVGSTPTVTATLEVVPYQWKNLGSGLSVEAELTADEPYIAVVPYVTPFQSDAKVTSLKLSINGDEFYAQNKRCYVAYCGSTNYGNLTAGNYGVKKVSAGTVKITMSYTLSSGSGQGILNARKLVMPTGI